MTMSREVCPPSHKHAGSGTCYVKHRCGCVPCREAAVGRERRRRKQIAYGRYDTGLVDVVPVREHIERLRAFGIGWKRVADLAGVSTSIVETIIYGQKDRPGEFRRRVKRETADAILAVEAKLENLRAGALIPAVGSIRRVQALAWNGWSIAEQARLIGMEPTNMQRMMTRDVVQLRTAYAIRGLFDRLWDQVPPVVRPRDNQRIAMVRNAARRKGWVSALAWEDIDDPCERAKGAHRDC